MPTQCHGHLSLGVQGEKNLTKLFHWIELIFIISQTLRFKIEFTMRPGLASHVTM